MSYSREARLVTPTFLIVIWKVYHGKRARDAVSLKLPEFWTSHLRVWFQQTEAQFALGQVTADNTKYFYLVAALDQDSAQRVIDLLEDPPRDHKYLAL